MTDKELLELAAKASGFELQQWSAYHNTFYLEPYQQHWNPLTKDGDALRLAVKLEMYLDLTIAMNNEGMADVSANKENVGCDNDPYAATRRAIVRAAAEIGRTK